MGGQAVDQISKGDEASGSDATIEIKIKTLDSQTYTLRVDKQMPVPALKEQIASVTGVVSEQQRLICRGKVLKDDQLLSAYHVEDGHTLHLVVRQPIPPLSEGSSSQPAADFASDMGRTRGRSIVIETISMPHQGDGVPPEISRIVSAVLGSFGIPHSGSGAGGTEVRDHGAQTTERIFNGQTQQQEQPSRRDQSDRLGGLFELPRNIGMGSLQPPVITDSLTTLSQYLGQMRREFDGIGRVEGNDVQAESNAARIEEMFSTGTMHAGAVQQGLPSPASLAEVSRSTRQILLEQAGDSLLQLARQLQNQENVVDPLERSNIQTTAWRTGVLFHNLGATLLELGRTIMTLRLGQAPSEAVVNAGPAVFISPSGPNPLMVQPFSFQSGTSIGTLPPTGSVTAGTSMVNGLGSGLLPRRIDIQIRRGTSVPASNVSQDEAGDTQHQSGHRNPEMNSGGESRVSQPTTEVSEGPTSAGDLGVRVLPVRTVVAAVPSSLTQLPSDSPGNRIGLYYPVLGRIQHVSTAPANATRDSQASGDHNPAAVHAEVGQQSSHESAMQQDLDARSGSLPAFNLRRGPSGIHSAGSISINILSSGGSRSTQDSERQMPDSMLQFLQNLFPGGEVHVEDAVLQGTATTSNPVHVGTSNAAMAVHGTDGRATDEGMFLSNLLQQIMPVISQNLSSESNAADSAEANASGPRMPQGSSPQAENSSAGTSRRSADSEPSPPNSKRQKTE